MLGEDLATHGAGGQPAGEPGVPQLPLFPSHVVEHEIKRALDLLHTAILAMEEALDSLEAVRNLSQTLLKAQLDSGFDANDVNLVSAEAKVEVNHAVLTVENAAQRLRRKVTSPKAPETRSSGPSGRQKGDRSAGK